MKSILYKIHWWVTSLASLKKKRKKERKTKYEISQIPLYPLSNSKWTPPPILICSCLQSSCCSSSSPNSERLHTLWFIVPADFVSFLSPIKKILILGFVFLEGWRNPAEVKFCFILSSIASGFYRVFEFCLFIYLFFESLFFFSISFCRNQN